MGSSPHAYPLWVATIEPRIRANSLSRPAKHLAPICLIIRTQNGQEGLRDTLASAAGSSDTAKVVVIDEHRASPNMHVDIAARLSAIIDEDLAWVCIVDAGDLLAPHALELYARTAAELPDRRVIYADDDLLGVRGRREPHFKPDWNPDLFSNHDFVTGSAIIRITREIVSDLRDSDWAKALTKSALAMAVPVHLPLVLHHRRSRPAPSVPPKRALLSQDGSAPLVSVIVPTRNRLLLLETCLNGVRSTHYPNVELIVVDNDSDDPATLTYLDRLRGEGAMVLRIEGPFNFSALNNAAAARASGDLLCFLNNDVEIVDPDWLSLLVQQAVRSELGAVGARLLYPDRNIQHAGVVIGVGGGAAHAHRLLHTDDEGYFLRHRLPQRVSAVTAACLVVSKRKFVAVKGFNEREFPVAFNDVDLCMKLNSQGWQSFYEPRAVLLHHESKSRGSDTSAENRARFAGELAALKRHWQTDRLRDPFHHPNLSPFSEKFVIGF